MCHAVALQEQYLNFHDMLRNLSWSLFAFETSREQNVFPVQFLVTHENMKRSLGVRNSLNSCLIKMFCDVRERQTMGYSTDSPYRNLLWQMNSALMTAQSDSSHQ